MQNPRCFGCLRKFSNFLIVFSLVKSRRKYEREEIIHHNHLQETFFLVKDLTQSSAYIVSLR